MKHLALVTLALAGFIGLSYGQATGNDVTTILNKILTDTYDKRVRPGLGEGPLVVGVTMYIIEATQLSLKTSKLTTEMYFRQMWVDKRLAYNFGQLDSITGGKELDDKIWKPDTFMANDGSADLMTGPKVFVRINKDGSILRSVMVESNAHCNVNLNYFPYDTQICALEFESYGHNANEIKYELSKGQDSVGYPKGMRVKDLEVQGTVISRKDISLTTGNYSRIVVEIILARNPGHFCRNFFLPAIVFCLVTYLTFWLPFSPDSSATFRGLCHLTSVVCHWLLLSKSSDRLPWLNSSTRLEQYMVTCLILSILSLIEFLVVLVLRSNAANQNKGEDLEMADKKNSDKQDVGSYVSRSAHYLLTIRQHRRAHHKIDLFSRMAYALIFIIYNIWFWISFPPQGNPQ